MKKSQLKLFLKKIITEAKLLENIQDPSKDEMFNYLRQMYGNEEGFRDDAEVAIYWFANFYHGGQSSNLYSVLSTSRFSPGPIARGPEPQSSEEMMYEDLVLKYAPGTEEAIEIQKKHNSLNEMSDEEKTKKLAAFLKRGTKYRVTDKDSAQDNLYHHTIENDPKTPRRMGDDFKTIHDIDEGDEADAVNDMWAGSDDDLSSYKEPKKLRPKQKSKKFFNGSNKPKPKTVQDFDWERIKRGIDKGTLKESFEDLMNYRPQGKWGATCGKCRTHIDVDIGKYGNFLRGLGANGWKFINGNYYCPKCQSEQIKENNVQQPNPLDGKSNVSAAQNVNKVLSELSKGIFSDDNWEPIHKIFEKLKQLGMSVTLLGAKYGGHQETSNGMPKYKEWQISIPFTNKVGKPMELVGQITAHGAGSVEQPLDRYDITAYVSAIPARK